MSRPSGADIGLAAFDAVERRDFDGEVLGELP